ncbi:hypothetical protein V6N12_063146 [Hibiscus sabdariffa]|uniref:Uncharacterized protein n=1 Tax=Hibiscus sabdariffa TaxID=183260 RepID=A0ABR2FAV7_9ROSI
MAPSDPPPSAVDSTLPVSPLPSDDAGEHETKFPWADHCSSSVDQSPVTLSPSIPVVKRTEPVEEHLQHSPVQDATNYRSTSAVADSEDTLRPGASSLQPTSDSGYELTNLLWFTHLWLRHPHPQRLLVMLINCMMSLQPIHMEHLLLLLPSNLQLADFRDQLNVCSISTFLNEEQKEAGEMLNNA